MRWTSASFGRLLAEVSDMGRLYDGAVFIGSIAVYLHAVNDEATSAFAEPTKDVDFYISLASLSDLRETEELTGNSRLARHEFWRSPFSFGVYAERQSRLPVPYDVVAAHAVEYDGIRVAALEDLLLLRLQAAADRHASAHAPKDARDVIRILLLADGVDFDADRSVAYMTPKHLERLRDIVEGPEFTAIAEGRVKVANGLRKMAARVVRGIENAYEGAEPLSP